MKIVLDNNVLISGVINPDGKPANIINLVLNGKIRILYDNRIIKEYLDVLYRERFDFDAELIEALIDFIRIEGEFVVSDPIMDYMQDESDKKFLEVAISGKAEYLITGNKRHFPQYKLIANPAEFLKLFS